MYVKVFNYAVLVTVYIYSATPEQTQPCCGRRLVRDGTVTICLSDQELRCQLMYMYDRPLYVRNGYYVTVYSIF